jgi:hypothetical protein
MAEVGQKTVLSSEAQNSLDNPVKAAKIIIECTAIGFFSQS